MADWFQKQKIGDLPALAANKWGQREALYFKGQRWTFDELNADIDRLAKGLIAIGVNHGDNVCLLMTNRPEWIFVMFALAKIGAVLVPMNTRFRTNDIQYTIGNSESTAFITIDQSGPINYAEMIYDVLPGLSSQNPQQLNFPELPKLKRMIMLSDVTYDGCLSWDAVIEAGKVIGDDVLAQRAAMVDPDNIVIISYTSGTTGNPKGVTHGHCCIRNVLDTANRWGVTFNDVLMNYLPMFHLYAYSASTLFSVLTGAKQVLMDMFDGDEVLQLIEQEKATMIHGFDAHYRDILAALERTPRDLSSLRLGTFPAGQETSAKTARIVQDKLCPTVSVYGMTELWCFPSTTFLDSTVEQRCEASGFPSSGYEFRIVDGETGEDLPNGQAGEVLVRSYMVTKGYFRNPEATAELIDKDGWLHSGDQAMIRPDGHIRFMGRLKDMLKVGGENVAPAEIEVYLEKFEEITSAAVIGYPDERLGEVPVAFVITCEKQSIDDQAIINSFKGKIASFKIPRHLIVVDEFPMTATGKLRKNLLKDMAIEMLG